MSYENILREVLHSYQFNMITNNELRAIMIILENANHDYEHGKNSKDKNWPRDYDMTVEVLVNGVKVDKLEGEIKN